MTKMKAMIMCNVHALRNGKGRKEKLKSAQKVHKNFVHLKIEKCQKVHKCCARKVHKILPSCAHSRRAVGLPIPPPRATKIPARGFTVAWPEGILGGSALRSVSGERT